LSQRNRKELIASKIRIDSDTGCHIWTGATYGKGYGQTKINGRTVPVHRLMWEACYGPIPDGLQVDHVCGIKACCNVHLLRLLTNRENTLAGNNKAAQYARRVNCDKCGGPFSHFSNGIRYCKPCRNATMLIAQRIRRAKKKGTKE
jgi:hypothetical protein